MTSSPAIVPLYTTRGDAEAFLVYPYIYNRQGEWVGFVTPAREVYSVLGNFIGELSLDKRILRPRSMTSEDKPRKNPPARPPRLRLPSGIPLPPLMRELPHSQVDVLEEEPERLHTLDSGEMRQDMD
ncbi:MAG: hypothetical protein Fur0035_22230 [Anaerolineales bacterium]